MCRPPYRAGDTFIVQSGEKGQYQGMLELTFAPDGARTAENELVPLGPNIPDDPRIKAMIDQYNEKVTSHCIGQSWPLSADHREYWGQGAPARLKAMIDQYNEKVTSLYALTS